MSEKGKLPLGYKAGVTRPFFTSNPLPLVIDKAQWTSLDRFFIFMLFSVGVLVRLRGMPIPNYVVFDEVNFGGFVHEYFNGKFFIDVHPPLGKLMYYWVAVIFGYNGEFLFDRIGDPYDENVPFVAMRLLSGICGLLVIPLTYLTLRNNFCGAASSAFGSILVLLENSLATQSRFIFLDSPLMLAMVFSLYAFSKFRNVPVPFSYRWYFYLCLTGIGLGLTLSIKNSALLTFVWFGVLTFGHLWRILGDLEVSDFRWWKHVVNRVWFLVVLPVTIYAAIFAVHFNTVPLASKGIGPMSPNFKATMKDYDKIRNVPVEVGYGSSVTLKHNSMDYYLHSHDFKYRGGSKLQQVTLYPYHTDFNNEWEIHPKSNKSISEFKRSFKPIKDGDIVRLYHKNTKRYMYVRHDKKPPITEKDYAKEVSCNSTNPTTIDSNYDFKVRIMDKKAHSTTNLPMIKVRATESVFQLVHQGARCTLVSHKGKLPRWGFGQNEVLCITEPTIPNTLWYIENNNHPALNKNKNAEKVHLDGYPFYKKFLEYHKVMFRFNNYELKENHPYSSTPETWPVALRGISYYSSEARVKSADDTGSNVYFLGNVAIYYFGVIAVVLVSLKQVIYIINHLNPFSLPNETVNVMMFYEKTLESLLGFVIHYLPYFYMQRQMFAHHYLPALYLSILTITYFIEYQLSRRKVVGYVLMGAILVLAAFCYWQFLPLIEGTEWTKEGCRKAKWFENWDFDCMAYKY